nr:MAG TPA: hypothetical protein [Caudoviricetes sp.]DAU41380.1 MAG TPA: hypothetical protein [Bacteriophage sp.]
MLLLLSQNVLRPLIYRDRVIGDRLLTNQRSLTYIFAIYTLRVSNVSDNGWQSGGDLYSIRSVLQMTICYFCTIIGLPQLLCDS